MDYAVDDFYLRDKRIASNIRGLHHLANVTFNVRRRIEPQLCCVTVLALCVINGRLGGAR